MTLRRACCLALLLAPLAACDFGKESEKWRDRVEALERQVDLMRRMVDENWKATVKAVPGERYLQLIDALHGDDGPEKEAAKRFLISLGNLREEDLASPWVVSVWAEFEGEGPVRMDALMAPSPSRLHVEQFVKERGFKPAQSMGGETLHRPPTRDEIEGALDRELGVLFDALAGYPGKWHGSPRSVPTWANGQSSHSYQFKEGLVETAGTTIPVVTGPQIAYVRSYNFNPLFQKGGTSRHSSELAKDYRSRVPALISERRTRFVDHLKKAILSPIDTVPLTTASLHFEEPWDVIGKAQTLFLLVSEKDWKQVGGVRITAAVHKAGDASATHPASRVVRIDPSEFTQPANPPVEDLNPRFGRYLWTAVRMIDYQSYERSTPATTYMELKTSLEELDRLLGLEQGP